MNDREQALTNNPPHIYRLSNNSVSRVNSQGRATAKKQTKTARSAWPLLFIRRWAIFASAVNGDLK
jgi:hypothetical protein